MVGSLYILLFNKSIMRHIRNILIFLILLFILDCSIGDLLRKYYFKMNSGSLAKVTFILDKMNADVLIIGASTATHNYVPEIFEESLNLSFFNAGRDGTGLLYYNALISVVLKRYTPNIIILDLSPYSLDKSYDDKARASILLPYLKGFSEIRPFVLERSKFEKLKLLSHIYPFNSLAWEIIRHQNPGRNVASYLIDKGYLPLSGEITEDCKIPVENKIIIDKDKVRLFHTFLNNVKNYHSKLIIVIPPYIGSNKSHSIVSDYIENICKGKNVMCLNFSNEPDFKNSPELFHSIGHLNHNGAVLLSKRIVAFLKNRF